MKRELINKRLGIEITHEGSRVEVKLKKKEPLKALIELIDVTYTEVKL